MRQTLWVAVPLETIAPLSKDQLKLGWAVVSMVKGVQADIVAGREVLYHSALLGGVPCENLGQDGGAGTPHGPAAHPAEQS